MAGFLIGGHVSGNARLVANDAISATLRLWAQTRFVWGTSDCLISVVRHVAEASGQAMPPWPRYSTGAGALRILERAGGLERYAARVLERMGCSRTQFPCRGDVGLIDIPGTGPTMCLCLGAKWAARGQEGIVIVPAGTGFLGCEAAWKLPVSAVVTGGKTCLPQ